MKRITAVFMLRDAGHFDEAMTLLEWTNKQGKAGGWDQMFRTAFPHLVSVLWPKQGK